MAGASKVRGRFTGDPAHDYEGGGRPGGGPASPTRSSPDEEAAASGVGSVPRVRGDQVEVSETLLLLCQKAQPLGCLRRSRRKSRGQYRKRRTAMVLSYNKMTGIVPDRSRYVVACYYLSLDVGDLHCNPELV